MADGWPNTNLTYTYKAQQVEEVRESGAFRTDRTVEVIFGALSCVAGIKSTVTQDTYGECVRLLKQSFSVVKNVGQPT